MVKIVYENNNPIIEINGERIPPAAFRSFRPTPSNISLFDRIGVRFYQMLCSGKISALGIPYSLFGEIWTGDDCYDFSRFDKQMEMFQKFAPKGYFCIMIQLDTPSWWLEKHKNVPDSFRNLSSAAVSKEWKNDASKYLQEFIKYAEEKYGDRIYCYSFSSGFATEWFSNDFGKETPIKLEAYRKFTGNPDAVIPNDNDYIKGDFSLRAPNSNETRYIDYCCNLTSDLICFYAQKAQEIINHKKLTGLFFGYFSLSDTKLQSRWMTNGYEKVWACKDIDIIFSPAAYGKNRDLDGASSYQICVDSVMINNKIYLHEIDHRTELAKYPLENGAIIDDCYEDSDTAITVLRRELCNTLIKNSSLWWFDFTGGYYNSPIYEEEIKRQLEIYNMLSKSSRKQISEIAVFIDPMSFNLMKENTNLSLDLVKNNIMQLHKCGVPFEIFNLKDIRRIDMSKYKMAVFLNALRIDADVRSIINDLSCYKFFLYAPDAGSDSDLDFNKVKKITNMDIEYFETNSVEKVLYNGESFGFETVINPMPEIKNAEILAYYENGKGAVGLKDKTFFCSCGNISYSLWRDAAKKANCHIYTQKGENLALCSQFISVQSTNTENEITMPFDCILEELFDGGIYKTQNKKFTYKDDKYRTKLFLIKEKL